MRKYVMKLTQAFVLLSILVPGHAQPIKKLQPKPNLPIDCASYNQPCTGTACVNQQLTYYCAADDKEIICQNDSQNYVGGNQICCTGRNPCDRCFVNGRWFYLYNYNGVQASCTPNP